MTEMPLLLSVTEAASLLRVGRTLAYELIARGDLPYVRLGRTIKLPRAGLEEWIERATVGARLLAPCVPRNRQTRVIDGVRRPDLSKRKRRWPNADRNEGSIYKRDDGRWTAEISFGYGGPSQAQMVLWKYQG